MFFIKKTIILCLRYNLDNKVLTWHMFCWHGIITESIISTPVLLIKMLPAHSAVLENEIILESQNFTTNSMKPSVKKILILGWIWKFM